VRPSVENQQQSAIVALPENGGLVGGVEEKGNGLQPFSQITPTLSLVGLRSEIVFNGELEVKERGKRKKEERGFMRGGGGQESQAVFSLRGSTGEIGRVIKTLKKEKQGKMVLGTGESGRGGRSKGSL